jgi:hypothetical protein
MPDTATPQGAAPKQQPTIDPDVDTSQEIEVRPHPRQAALDAMAERQEQVRIDEISEAIKDDPDLAAQQARIDGAIQQANAEAGIVHEDETPAFGPNDGAASREPMHEETTPTPRQDLPSNLQDDPLADFIVMNGAVPMVKAKVNGTDRLIPLADAKRQVQIGVAAEVRMQNAAQAEKILEDRERKLTAGEAALQARMTVAASQPATPVVAEGLSDEDLEREATEVFETAFSGTEEDAAKKLARTLVKIRDARLPVQPTQPIDTQAIAREAANIATGTLSAESRKKDVNTGYQQFQTNYPEIVKDPQLFKMADGHTEVIEREHPDWDMTQIMDEAGKRTREWVKGLTGQTDDTGDNRTGDTPPQPPGDQNSPKLALTENRLERKAGLVRMPTPAAGAQHSEPEPANENEQSPQDAFMEIKKARGQAV